MVYRAIKNAEQRIKGGLMRAAVMAALHFDFPQAQELSSRGDTAFPYSEDETNMQNFVNLLAQLKDLATE